MGILGNICRDNGICLAEINGELSKLLGLEAPSGRGAGLAFRAEDVRFILYDGAAGRYEKQFIVAHELAHHLFGHLEEGRAGQWERNEQEANIFAAVFIALSLFGMIPAAKTKEVTA